MAFCTDLDPRVVFGVLSLLAAPPLYFFVIILLALFAFGALSTLIFTVIFGFCVFALLVLCTLYSSRLILFHHLRWERRYVVVFLLLALCCLVALYGSSIPLAIGFHDAWQDHRALGNYVNITDVSLTAFQLASAGPQAVDYFLFNNGAYDFNASAVILSADLPSAPPPGSAYANQWWYLVPIVASLQNVSASSYQLWALALIPASSDYVDSAAYQALSSTTCSLQTAGGLPASYPSAAPLSPCQVFNGGAFSPEEGYAVFSGPTLMPSTGANTSSTLASNGSLAYYALSAVQSASQSLSLPPFPLRSVTVIAPATLYRDFSAAYTLSFNSALAAAITFDLWLVLLMPLIGYALSIDYCVHSQSAHRRTERGADGEDRALMPRVSGTMLDRYVVT
jgi:hypothetical protein